MIDLESLEYIFMHPNDPRAGIGEIWDFLAHPCP